MRTCADFIAQAKKALGNERMSDRELGERIGGYKQQTIASGKHGNMSDNLAKVVAMVAGVQPGEVIMAAKLEREKDPEIKAALADWLGKISGLLPTDEAALRPALVAGPDVPMLHAIESASAKRKARQVSRAGSRRGLAEMEGFEPSIHFWRMLP
jgi:hypothetical protein